VGVPGAQFLVGLRTLQLVYFAGGQQNRPTRVSGLLDLLTAFDYPTVLGEAVIEEYQSFELLSVTPEEDSPDEPLASHWVRMAPKGAGMLSEMIDQVAYLGLGAMRVPLAPGAAARPLPFVRGTALAYTSSTDWLREWVSTKILNSAALIRLVREVDRRQREGFVRNLRDLRPELQKVGHRAASGGMFGVADGMEHSFRDQADRILDELNAQGLVGVRREVEDQIEVYLRKWMPSPRDRARAHPVRPRPA
jgi:hypothetical protein